MTANGGEEKKPDRVQFVYTQAPDYRIAAANGALGGPTPQGDFLIDFYCERAQMPLVEEHKVTTEGRLGQKVYGPGVSSDVPQIERYVQFGVMLSPKQAMVLAKWIRKHIDDMKQSGQLPGDWTEE